MQSGNIVSLQQGAQAALMHLDLKGLKGWYVCKLDLVRHCGWALRVAGRTFRRIVTFMADW
jgi:hypothetical protein